MAHQPIQDELLFIFGDTAWENYVKFRPAYPPSLIELFRDYHQKYGSGTQLAHDVASGSGVFVPSLATELGFEHIHVSDPSAGNMKSAQSILSSWLKSQESWSISNPSTGSSKPPILTFSRTTGEKLHTCTADSAVDMITVMEAAHWTDADLLTESALRALKPGGTLAIALYSGRVHIKENLRVDKALRMLFQKMWLALCASKGDLGSEGRSKLERGLAQAHIGLDFVPLYDHSWTNTRRIRIGGKGKGEWPHETLRLHESPYSTSRVRPDENYEYYEYGHRIAEGWDKVVGKDWFVGYLKSMEALEDLFETDEYKKFMEVLSEEFVDDRVPVGWVTDVVLASKA